MVDLNDNKHNFLNNVINKRNNFKRSIFWEKLLIKKNYIKDINISTLFIQDPNRFNNFSIQDNNINMLYDFSKQHIDQSILHNLILAAKHCELNEKIQDLFKGNFINVTENKLVSHTSLRDENASIEIQRELSKIEYFVKNLYNSEYTDVICLGIGGSYLGPMFVSNALFKYTYPLANNINLHFIANCDTSSINLILNKLNPRKTIIIINSKSFTTIETINNSQICINWLRNQVDNHNYLNQIFAITSNVDKAIKFGIIPDNIFAFSNTVGGRYSIWSAVGLPVIIKIGLDNFKRFLKGAYLIDEHFKNNDLINNIPVIMGLVSVWNINFMQYKSLAIISYLDALNNFSDYLQQLSMESNGKSVNLDNKEIDYDTGEIIFGGLGCNVQHSFMQMLYQGTQNISVDFIASSKEEFLFANCIAQSQALMQGLNNVDTFKKCKGNCPNSIILFPELTPEVLGSLIAMYEHKVFVQSVMWNINSFDQWGVELGKNLVNQILTQIKLQHNNIDHMDQINQIPTSILNLIKVYNKFNC